MKVLLALAADAANLSTTGKLNVLGAFNTVGGPEFPLRLPSMQIVLRFECMSGEFGEPKKVQVKLLAEDGQELGNLEAELLLGKDLGVPRLIFDHILPIKNIDFPEPGSYAVAIVINGLEQARIELTVTKAESRPQGDDDGTNPEKD